MLDLVLIGTGYAFSQYIVLRSGAFSVATAGFASVGAYLAAILTTRYGLPWPASVAASAATGMFLALLLSVPLASLRGVFQAIASLAFVQIVESLTLYADDLTGGPLGFNGIPKVARTPVLLVAVLAVLYVLWAINRGGVGRVFDAMRQDVAVASSLGVDPSRYHTLAFALSGAIAGLFGALEAFHGYSISPEQFGFPLVVSVLSYVILGGRRSLVGPVVGAAILIFLPEISRPLAQNRMAIDGVLLVVVIGYLPYGVADTALRKLRRRRLAREAGAAVRA